VVFLFQKQEKYQLLWVLITHCEERSDVAISKFLGNIGLATLPMVARDDKMGVFHNALMWYPDRSGQIPLRRLAEVPGQTEYSLPQTVLRVYLRLRLLR